ncbi:MAG: hypothetical protein JXQ27_03325 [Acidobacteria bacterium]|nr:hypothetical protein [Acidobacteriota bacterium]
MSKKEFRRLTALGRIALWFSGLLASAWMLRGVVLAFHEGWWQPEPGARLAGLLTYLAPALVLMALVSLALLSHEWGGALMVLAGLGLGAAALLHSSWLSALADMFGVHVLPLTLAVVFIGGLFGWEARLQRKRPSPPVEAGAWRRSARWLVILAMPTVCLLVDGLPQLIRAESRYDDGIRGIRRVSGNGVTLEWAPEGPGWQCTGEGNRSWNELARYGRYEAHGQSTVWTAGMTDATTAEMAATGLGRYLRSDGRQLQAEPADVWRLPTVAEVVASLTCDGRNAGGRWDPVTGKAEYARRPNKESPLWAVHAPVSYYWTATEADPGHAYVVTYNGRVLTLPKDRRAPAIGYRCVRSP